MHKEIMESLQWRYATKKFDPTKKIDDQTIEVLLESLRLTPSSFGLQPWHFIVITNDELKAELRQHSWNQEQITDCSHLIVHCALKKVTETDIEKFIQLTASERNQDPSTLDGYKEMMAGALLNRTEAELKTWSQKQVYISQGFLMETAALLQVDACPMEGFSPSDYDRILGLESSNFTSTLVTPLGYRSSEDKYATAPKVRFAKTELFDFRK